MRTTVLAIIMSFVGWSLSAQDFASTFLQKHGDKEFEVISIGKQMLSMLGEMSSKDQDLKKAIQELESIKIISSDSKEKARKSFKNAHSMLTKKSSGFSEIMTLKVGEETTLIMTREEDGVIKDFVLLTSSDSTFNMICLSGDIDMGALGKLASNMQLNKLKKLNVASQDSTKTKK